MCGINGCMLYENQKIDLKKQIIEMNNEIIHRGPDSEGVFVNKSVGIVMRRLSVIDLFNGDQPIFNEDHTNCIVFNGEIYNYQELKSELVDLGHVFSSDADTEVILHGYEEYGTDIINKLNGMFAFCIYDLLTNTFTLARDRAGQKPLYYYAGEKYFVFGSDLKSIMDVWEIPKTIDKKALNLYLGLTYIPAPYTIYENLYKLEPGHYMTVSLSAMQIQSYWELDISSSVPENEESYIKSQEKLRTLIYESIKKQMVSDVPLGAFLSGGIDSSIVVGVMSELSTEPINTFSIGFNSKDFDESDKAAIVAKHNNTNHHVKILDYQDALGFIDIILDSMGEPFADSSAIPTYYLCDFAKEFATVVLTGDAGDELFAGYSKYLIGYYSSKYNKIPAFLRRGFIEPIVRGCPIDNSMVRKIRKVIKNAENAPFDQYLGLMKLGFRDISTLLTNEYHSSDAFDDIKNNFHHLEETSNLQKSLYSDFKTVLEGDMLTKVDRMSILNSIETRVPFLDNAIIDFAFSLPDSFKMEGRKLKRILKDTFRDNIPEEVLSMAKHGFGVPLGEWFRGPLKERLIDMVSEEKITAQGIFEYKQIQKIVEEHMSKREDHASGLWALFVFQHWYNKSFLGGTNVQ